MYYSNIANSELQYFKNLLVNNFTIKLSDVLTTEGLFKVEEIIANSIYKIYPMFYTQTITSSNSNDRILDNRCIICQKQEDKETYLTFISDENSDIHDFQSFAEYFNITDNLTTNQYNHIVSLLRHNTIHNDTFKIIEEHQGNYAKYTFNVDNCTITDAGIIIDADTRLAEPKVKLTGNVFHYSTYVLQLSILHYTGVNILDDSTEDYIVVDTMELELPPNEWVIIPLDDLEDGYIISLHSNVKITHDKPIIPDWIQSIDITGEPTIIQTGENAEIYATGLDNGGLPVGEGHTIHFFEKLEPTINVSASQSIIQTNDPTEIYAKVKDSDGSLAQNVKVHFYQVEEEPVPVPSTLTVVSDKDILSYNDGDSTVLTATVLDEDDNPLANENVIFKIGSSVLDTVMTDDSGVAEYEYSSQGIGDVVFTAECGELVETISIEDCIKYIASGSYTFSSSSMTFHQLYGVGVIGDCEISTKLKSANTKGFALEYRKDNNVDNNNRVRIGVGGDNKLLASVISNGVEDLNYEGSNYSANSDVTCKIVCENNSIKGTIANSTYTMRDISDLRYVGINNWNNAKTVTYTDLKIKPL